MAYDAGMTRRLTISVSDEVHAEIKARAAEQGMDVSNYLEGLAHRDHQAAQLRAAFQRRAALGLDQAGEERAKLAWQIAHPDEAA